MRNYNRYRRSQYDRDRYEDRNDRFNDRYNDYDDYNRHVRQDYNRQFDQDPDRPNYNPDYQAGDWRSQGNRQYDYDAGYGRSYRGVDDNYTTRDFQNRNYRYGTFERDWRDDNWRSNDSYYSNRPDYDRQDRGWWDKTRDEVASWFGDEDAKRRRRMDEIRDHRGKGPKNYQRSSDRIKEDVNDKLSDNWMLDASNIEVDVKGSEVTLNGTVESREDKRRAEDIAEDVSGVTHIQNNLRVSKTEESDVDQAKTYSARARKSEIHHN